jgi:UDPglucose--hexose-1-phosphate uridylyltransferase
MQELRIDPLSGLRVAIGPTAAADSDAPREPATVGDDPLAGGRGQPELFAARPGAGVVEEIATGGQSLLELDTAGMTATLETWRTRMRAGAAAPFRHLAVDETPGHEPRTRLYALPFVPAAVARERERFTAYRDRTQGRNLLEDLLTEEVRNRERVVFVDGEAIAICPFASAVPFHVQVIPRKPAARFEDDGPLGAAVLRDALARVDAELDGGLRAFSLWVRTAPSGAESFCWRIDLLPRGTEPGALELGTGVWLNELSPERAAERLRAVTST